MAGPIVLNFVTGNANKLAEVKAILEPAAAAGSETSPDAAAITVTSRKVDLIEIQAGSMEEVTLDKCRRAVELVSLPYSTNLCQYLFANFARSKDLCWSRTPACALTP